MKKMLLLGVGLALAAGLGWTASARAEPLDPAQVSAEAKWLAHLDVDAMRASTVVQRAWKKGRARRPISTSSGRRSGWRFPRTCTD